MSTKIKKKSFLTFMLVPHDSGKSLFSLKISKLTLYIFTATMILIVFLIIGSFFYSSSLTRKLIDYSSIVARNKLQKHQIGTLKKKLAVLDVELSELLERDQQIRGLLGLGNFNMDKASATLQKKKINYAPDQDLGALDSIADNIDSQLLLRQASYKSLKEIVSLYQKRFAHTPSIVPVYGRMGSRFGWRKHPILGAWHFHRGVDFPTWRGAPVKSTADGIVKKTTWLRGYGKTVVIDHLYGLKTLYAHNSRFLVKKGMKVKKGQVIAEAGSSGLSTGVHVHYEVLKGNRPVYPNTYLKLDLFTAARYNYW